MVDPIDERANGESRILTRQKVLPEGGLLLYQSFGVNPIKAPYNVKLLIMNDGRAYRAHNEGFTLETIVDTELPKEPSGHLDPALVDAIKKTLLDKHFFDEPAVREGQAEDGSVKFLVARIDGRTHEVMYSNAPFPLYDLIAQVLAKVP